MSDSLPVTLRYSLPQHRDQATGTRWRGFGGLYPSCRVRRGYGVSSYRAVPFRGRKPHVAAGMTIADRPPVQIRTGGFTHTALILDGWRGSEHQDKDAEYEEGESTGSREGRDDPIAPVRVDCDGLKRPATTSKRDGERCPTESSYPEQRGIGNIPAQPFEAMHRPRSCDDASGVEAQP